MCDRLYFIKIGMVTEMEKETYVGEATNLVTGQISFTQRAADIQLEESAMLEAAERAKKNDNFFMVFRGKDRGAERLIELAKVNGKAASFFLYLSKEMDKANALVASNKALAEVMGVSEATMSRTVAYLVENGFIAKFKSGGSSVFVANPAYVWNTWDSGKKTCLFNNSKVLLAKSEQDLTVTKRFNVVMRKMEKAELEVGQKKRGRPRKIAVENEQEIDTKTIPLFGLEHDGS